ncbi:MAG: hypothetical protein GY762_22120 [Proteobacteria bacterium]|nr:hypothetical protein [Pseudomonadota bacterium]
MLIIADNLNQVRSQESNVIGFFGVPPRSVLEEATGRLGLPLFDLDVYYGAPESKIVPDAYCHIIRNCVDNAVALGPRLACVVAATGKEKCDAGLFAAWLIKEVVGTKMVFTKNEALLPARPPLLSEALGPVKKRVVRIMRAIVQPMDDTEKARVKADRGEATHGFWGTPPHPIELLDLFPETTHLFGWTRCVEQGRPADLGLEMAVPGDLPIVFFSQGFCPKASLARHLAETYRGMHVDVHDALNAATRAKIEAFIRLSATADVSSRGERS